MKLAPLRIHPRFEIPLSPPITSDEVRWWRGVRTPFALRHVLQFGAPMFFIGLASSYLRYGYLRRGLMGMFILVALTGVGGWVMWLTQEKALRDQEVRWKRIRDDLLADPHEAVDARPSE